MEKISIDPITRLEGHGKIEIFLDESGEVDNAYFQVLELRGFEVFCLGRPAEEMPRLTNRICGVCPEAHHMAASKALDDLYHVDPPSAAKKLRELEDKRHAKALARIDRQGLGYLYHLLFGYREVLNERRG